MSAVLDLLNVLHEPTAVFGRVKEKPRILAPYIVLAILITIVAVLSLPFQAAVTDLIRAAVPPEQQARISSPSAVKIIIQTPIFMIVGFAIGAFLLWLGTTMAGAQAKYKAMFSVLTYSWVTYLIYAIVVFAVLSIKGASAIQSFADLRAPVGLDLLVPGVGLFAGAILNGINPFSIWGVVICATGVSVTSGCSKAAGYTITIVVFLIGLLLQAVPYIFLGMVAKQ